MITQTLKLNLIPGQVLPRVNVSQYDAGTRTLQMLLYNGDQAFNIPVGYGGFVQGTKPDRTGFQYAATVTEGSNVVTLVVTQQMAAVSGEVTCELVIANGNDRIATVNFILYVEPAALADDTVISDTELPLIEEAAELAQRIDGIAADVEADADRAEAAVEHYPYIGANGNWYVFDLQTEQFVDTTIAATGPQGPTGPTGPTGPQGPTGPTGNGIVSITKTGTSGLVDTYTITFTDGTTTTFTVTNGQDGQGSGDMTKAVYDSTNAVADAGGIVAYVAAHSGAGTLAGLDDVTLSSLAAGDTLVYNATTQKWENSTVIQTLTNQVATKANSSTVTALANDVDGISDEIADMNNVLGAKNLLKYSLTSGTYNEVVYTVNPDKTISVTTTGATASARFISLQADLSSLIHGKTYILNGCPSGGSVGTTYVLYLTDGTNDFVDAGNGIQFVYDSTKTYALRIVLYAGVNLTTPIVYEPMIRPASIQDSTYEPYSMTNQQMTPYVQAISNPNLLDNPWFTVNQRGATTKSDLGYFVDRWSIGYNPSASVVSLSSGVFSIDATNGIIILTQRFEDEILDGRTVTVSILLSDGTIKQGTGVFPSLNSTDVTFISETGYTIYGVHSTQDSGGREQLNILLNQGNTLSIKAIKLELGSVSTLAMDTAPNYATELLKCQRYFVRLGEANNHTVLGQGFTNSDGTLMWCDIIVPVKMRTKPSIKYTGTNNRGYTRFQGSQTTILTDAFSSIAGDNYHILVDANPVSGSTFPISAMGQLCIAPTERLDLSADL